VPDRADHRVFRAAAAPDCRRASNRPDRTRSANCRAPTPAPMSASRAPASRSRNSSENMAELVASTSTRRVSTKLELITGHLMHGFPRQSLRGGCGISNDAHQRLGLRGLYAPAISCPRSIKSAWRPHTLRLLRLRCATACASAMYDAGLIARSLQGWPRRLSAGDCCPKQAPVRSRICWPSGFLYSAASARSGLSTTLVTSF